MEEPEFIGLVEWWTPWIIGALMFILGWVLGRFAKASRIYSLEDEILRWRIVADRKGWRYTVKPLRSTEIESDFVDAHEMP